MSAGGLDPFLAEHGGVPAGLVEPGLGVLVPIGAAAASSARPTVIGYATVVEPAAQPDVWWVDLCTATGPLRQMYRRAEFVGVPSYGLLPVGCGCPSTHRPR